MRAPTRAALRSALVAALLSAPATVLACPVCFNARETSRLAFFWTMILMTFLPLGLIGGTLYWLWRRTR